MAADEPGQPPALTSLSLAPESAPSVQKAISQLITPFTVSGGVDEAGKLLPVNYDKLILEFGATPITPELLARFERVTRKKAHRFLRRGIVFSHRDLELILDRYERGEEFFLYTGRGSSSDSMHVGHTVPFEFTKSAIAIALTKPLINLDANCSLQMAPRRFRRPPHHHVN